MNRCPLSQTPCQSITGMSWIGLSCLWLQPSHSSYQRVPFSLHCYDSRFIPTLMDIYSFSFFSSKTNSSLTLNFICLMFPCKINTTQPCFCFNNFPWLSFQRTKSPLSMLTFHMMALAWCSSLSLTLLWKAFVTLTITSFLKGVMQLLFVGLTSILLVNAYTIPRWEHSYHAKSKHVQLCEERHRGHFFQAPHSHPASIQCSFMLLNLHVFFSSTLSHPSQQYPVTLQFFAC